MPQFLERSYRPYYHTQSHSFCNYHQYLINVINIISNDNNNYHNNIDNGYQKASMIDMQNKMKKTKRKGNETKKN